MRHTFATAHVRKKTDLKKAQSIFSPSITFCLSSVTLPAVSKLVIEN